MSVNSLLSSLSLRQVQAQLVEQNRQNQLFSSLLKADFQKPDEFYEKIREVFHLPSKEEAKKFFQTYVETEISQGNWNSQLSPSVKRLLRDFQWHRVKFQDYILEDTPESLNTLSLKCSTSLQEIDFSQTLIYFEDIRRVSQFARVLRKIVLNKALVESQSRNLSKPMSYESSKILPGQWEKSDPLISRWNWTIYFPNLEIFQAEALAYGKDKIQTCWSIISPALALVSFKSSVGLQEVMITSGDDRVEVERDKTWLGIIKPTKPDRKTGWTSVFWVRSDNDQKFSIAHECEKRNLQPQFAAISSMPEGHPYSLYAERLISEIIPKGYVWMLRELLDRGFAQLGLQPEKVIQECYLLHEAASSPHIQILDELLRFKEKLGDYPHVVEGKRPAPPIVIAYQQGRIEHVLRLIPLTPLDVLVLPFKHGENKFERTLLHHALENNHVPIPQVLIQCSPDLLWIGDTNGTTPFHLLMEMRSIELLELIEVTHFTVDRLGWNPLHYAARAGSLVIAKKWLSRLDPDKKAEVIDQGTTAGLTPLHLTAQHGHLDFMQWLLGLRADLSKSDNQGRNALSFAVSEGRDPVVAFLLNTPSLYQAVQEHHNPFETAIHRRRWMTLRLLMERAVPQHVNGRGDFWPLAAALITQDASRFQALIDKGMSRLAREPKLGFNLLHVAIARGDLSWNGEIQTHPELLKDQAAGLLYSGVAAYFGQKKWLEPLLTHEKPGSLDASGYHALHYAILGRQWEAIEWLVSIGIDPLAETNAGENCYILAQRLGDTKSVEILAKNEKVKLYIEQYKRGQEAYNSLRIKGQGKGNLHILELLKKGVALNAKYHPEGKTLLQAAAESQNVDIIYKLIQLQVRADITFTTEKNPGWTGLHDCASRKTEESFAIFLLLIKNLSPRERVAFVRQTDRRGKTAYHYAKDNQFDLLAKKMIEIDPEISTIPPATAKADSSSDPLEPTESRLAFLSERIIPSDQLSSRASLKAHFEHKGIIYLIEMEIPSGKSPLPLLLSILNAKGEYEWKGTVRGIVDEEKKSREFSLKNPFYKAFHQFLHQLWKYWRQAALSKFDTGLNQKLPYDKLHQLYKKIEQLRKAESEEIQKIIDYTNQEKYRKDWVELLKQNVPSLNIEDLFYSDVEKILVWLERMSQTYDVNSHTKVWSQLCRNVILKEREINSILESNEFPMEICRTIYFERILDPQYQWGVHDLTLIGALKGIPFSVIDDHQIQASSVPPIPQSHRLIVKNKDGSLRFCSFYAYVQPPVLHFTPVASPAVPKPQPEEPIRLKNKAPASLPPPLPKQSIESLQRFIKNLDTLEKSPSKTVSVPQELLQQFEQLWSQFSEAGLDDFFMTLFARLNQLSQKAPSSHPPIEGRRWMGTYNQFSLNRRDGTLWPENASRASCTVNALTFLSFLPSRSIIEWDQKCSPHDPSNNIINEIIDKGRAHFEALLDIKKQELQSMMDTVQKNDGAKAAKALQWDIGSDALSVREIPQIQETFSLKPFALGRTILLTPDPQSLTTRDFFERLLKEWESQMKSPSMGAIIQCNGYSHAIALLRNEQRIEYIVFDSHGSEALNGNPHAFVYSTAHLHQAAQFLGNLVKYQDLQLHLLSKERQLELNKMAVYLFTN